MKRRHNETLAIQLGRWLGVMLQRLEFGSSLDLVMPVPIHWSRRLTSGFHAASLVADGVQQAAGLRKCESVLRCLRPTKKQGTLSVSARFENVRGAFGVRTKSRVVGKRILIVDDVMTSGATAAQTTKVLLKAGARQVFVAVVARGARVS